MSKQQAKTRVFCKFSRINSLSAGVTLIESLRRIVVPLNFDTDGIQSQVDRNQLTEAKLTILLSDAEKIRDNLHRILGDETSSVLFHINTHPFHGLVNSQSKNEILEIPTNPHNKIPCLFGSMRSYDLFYNHESFNYRPLTVEIGTIKNVPHEIRIQLSDKLKIIIDLDSIKTTDIVVNKSKPESVFVLLPLRYAPKIFKISVDPQNSSRQKYTRVFLTKNVDNEIQNIARSSDVVLQFGPNDNAPWFFLHKLTGALDPEKQNTMFQINFGVFNVEEWPRSRNKKRYPDPFKYRSASYSIRYGLQMLSSMGYVFDDKWGEISEKELGWESKSDEAYDLCRFVYQRLTEDHAYDLRCAANDFIDDKRRREREKPEKDPFSQNFAEKKLRIANCVLTPLKISFQPFEYSFGNRAVRNPKLGGEKCFLIVHLRDEAGDDLRISSEESKSFVREKMLHGIQSLGRNFVFLGSSTGQMKELSFWFHDLSKVKFSDVLQVHNQLGDFRNIRNIATYIARVGQYFSNTWPVDICLKKIQRREDIPTGDRHNAYVYEIEDITNQKYCFTDGIGKVSLGLAARIAMRMHFDLKCKEDIPSAYQIRVAGCKGMVSIDPESSLDEYYMEIRKSMIKFDSDIWDLEICDVARPLTLALNNQVIRLLSDLGVTYDGFKIYQQHAQIVHVENQPGFRIADIALRKSYSIVRSKESIKKNKIPIPSEEGRTLFGVADETGTLREGECFIQYTDLQNNRTKEYKVVEGTVIVTKNPCLWPGDVRQLKAVRNTTLQKVMRDVIVFPTVGKRAHCNEMAGSDLDGDQYWVYWGTVLKIKATAEPLDYTGASKATVSVIDQEIIVDHIVDTFGASGIIGMIANTHSVAAEKNDDHSFSDDCKKLAKLFSIAVDAPKTGVIIEKNKLRPFQSKYCDSWPLYMEKTDQPVYCSNSALERLYSEGMTLLRQNGVRQQINNWNIQFVDMSEKVQTIPDRELQKWVENELKKQTRPTQTPRRKPKQDSESESEPTRNPKSPPRPTQKPTRESNPEPEPIPNPKPAPRPRRKPKRESNPEPEPIPNPKPAPRPRRKPKQDSESESEPTPNPRLIPTSKQQPKRESESESEPTPDPRLIPTSKQKSKRESESESEPEPIPRLIPTSKQKSKRESNPEPQPPRVVSSRSMSSDEDVECNEAVNSFVMGKNIGNTNIKFQQPDDVTGMCIIETVNPNLKQVTKRELCGILQTMVTENVFRSNSLASMISSNRKLQLEAFYGNILFPVSADSLRKLDEIHKQVHEGSLSPQLRVTDINKLNRIQEFSSNRSKNVSIYEFKCYKKTCPGIVYTFGFDSSMDLQSVAESKILWNCFIRQKTELCDILLRLSSTVCYNDDAHFDKIINEIFKLGAKPQRLIRKNSSSMIIDNSMLKESIVPLSVTFVEKCHAVGPQSPKSAKIYRLLKTVQLDFHHLPGNIQTNALEFYVSEENPRNEDLFDLLELAINPSFS